MGKKKPNYIAVGFLGGIIGAVLFTSFKSLSYSFQFSGYTLPPAYLGAIYGIVISVAYAYAERNGLIK